MLGCHKIDLRVVILRIGRHHFFRDVYCLAVEGVGALQISGGGRAAAVTQYVTRMSVGQQGVPLQLCVAGLRSSEALAQGDRSLVLFE